ncbi:MAG: ABC transporter permease, partial [Kiritimatiellae bacterium]|nr:ABC transporter permease [Kiritimatiellia bacterium]
ARDGAPWAIAPEMVSLRGWRVLSGRLPDGADAPWELWMPRDGTDGAGEAPRVVEAAGRAWRVAGWLPRAPDPMVFPADAAFRTLADGEEADGIVFRVRDGHDLDAFRDEAARLLASLAVPDRPPVLRWTSAESLLATVDRFQEAVAWTAGVTAALALALGASLLGGLMVAKVRNRRREIGLRRALGATAADVEGLFFAEAALVAAFSGAVAMAAAAVAVRLLAARSPVPLAWNARVALSPLVSALLLSAACAFFPARAAGRLPPATALKSD